MYTAAVITISDKGYRGERVDTSGPNLVQILKDKGFEVTYTSIIPDEREMILTASLTERHARALLRLSGDDRLTALRQIITDRLNVAETESLVEEMLNRDAVPAAVAAPKPVIPRNRPAILRDVRLFCNSLHHAVDIMRQAGISATTEKRETPEGTEIRVFIPNVSRET